MTVYTSYADYLEAHYANPDANVKEAFRDGPVAMVDVRDEDGALMRVIPVARPARDLSQRWIVPPGAGPYVDIDGKRWIVAIAHDTAQATTRVELRNGADMVYVQLTDEVMLARDTWKSWDVAWICATAWEGALLEARKRECAICGVFDCPTHFGPQF